MKQNFTTKTRRLGRRTNNQGENQMVRLPPLINYSNIEFSHGFLDPHKYIKLHYGEINTQTLLTLAGSQYQYNLNSIFDPNRTGAGHQPYGFTQLAALYNRYRVLKVRWKIMMPPATTSYKFVIVPCNGTLPFTVTNGATYTNLLELPRAIARISSTTSPTLVYGGIALNNLGGVTQVEFLADDRFEAPVTASPSEVVPLTIGLYNPSAVTLTLDWQIDLDFTVDFHDPLMLVGS